MKRKFEVALLPVLLTLLVAGCRGPDQPPFPDGPYLGQEPPGIEPVLFAPGLISTGQQELSISFSPDGGEVFFLVTGPTYRPRFLLQSRMEGDGWTELEEVPFLSQDRGDSYPFVSPDGRRVLFNSERPYGRGGQGPLRGIWYVDRTTEGWSSPELLRVGDGDPADGAFPSVAANGNLFFNAGRDASGSDIYFSEFDGERYLEPVRLPPTVNSDAGDFHPYIAPDESFLMFDSNRAGDNFGSNDLYISFKTEDGSWSEAVNLGEAINTEASDLRPFVTADGEYLFFVSDRMVDMDSPGTPRSGAEVRTFLNRPGNGHQDIYWVSTEVLPRPSGG
jgi:Tol biopolymer transport system component